jgi:hypothetical protein
MNFLWSMASIFLASRIAANWFFQDDRKIQEFKGIRMVSDPVVIVYILSIGFGGMLYGMTLVDYNGIILVITLISLSVCQRPSFLMRIYCISIAILISLVSLDILTGLWVLWGGAAIPLISVFVINRTYAKRLIYR